MSSLPKELRKQLERVVLQARDEAERGAAAALEELGLTETKVPSHLGQVQEKLRRRLRARGKQVGDTQISDKSWDISHLIQECAYEHWHRMLFARFLAENDLLIHPEMNVAVSLEECEELAREGGLDRWELAARYAQQMLPEVFRQDDPVLQLRLPTEFRNRLTALLTSLPADVFTASDSLGWVYQFWQAKKKEEVNAAGNKIGADELPSVTQLFTEDYMVDFLLDNTLGAWWAGKRMKDEGGRMKFATEEDARQFVALPGCPWKYLRFITVPSSGEAADSTSALSLQPSAFSWTPAAGTFDGWPKSAAALRALDPCMGSGHFVVALFERLVALRLAEEKLDEAAAVAAVIRDNLFGLEIDPRCTQIGAFNLALAAWRRVGHCKLPAMNLACSGLAPNAKLEDWLAIVDAASSRIAQRQDAAATFAPINYFQPDEPVAHLMGNLPHWRQQGATYFVTFRCADALPQEKLKQWQSELDEWLARHPEPHDEDTRREFYEQFSQRIQAWLDAGYGECVLREPAMRQIVESAMRHFDQQRYRLQEFVVAANHVHALVTPLGEHLLSDILHSWKSFTSNQINKARGKSGTFWQKESFDHIVRSPASLAKFREYIQSHNVAAVNVAAASSRSQQEAQRLEAAATMKLKAGMERLYRLFQKAAVLGSLINPRAAEGDLLVAAFHELQPLLEKALKVEEASSLSSNNKEKSLEGSSTVAAASSRRGEEGKSLEGSATLHEMAVTARGLAKAAEILAGQFALVATNVPYLGRGKQDEYLKDYCERIYPDAKADLATCFVERCLEFCVHKGSAVLLTPQNWLFIGTYRRLREALLKGQSWNAVVRLGANAFQDMNWWAAKTLLSVLTRTFPSQSQIMFGLDVMGFHLPSEKATALPNEPFVVIPQDRQLRNPDARIGFEEGDRGRLLTSVATSQQGITTGDLKRFGLFFWEIINFADWKFWQSTTEETALYAGRQHVVRWKAANFSLDRFEGATLRGSDSWGKHGVLVSLMGRLPVTVSTGELSDDNTTRVLPNSTDDLPAIWAFASSTEFAALIREIDQAVKVMPATVLKIPFDLAHWQKVAAEKYPHGLPKPFSSDPTQWLFNGHPAGATVAAASSRRGEEGKRLEASATLQVAVARLLGYQWPRQTGSSFPDCPALGPDGLEKHADQDGIVCLSAVRNEATAADRLRALLADAFRVEAASSRSAQERQSLEGSPTKVEAASSRSSGKGESLEGSATLWNHGLERKLVAATVSEADSLEEWLVNDFFAQHCDIFHNRPFIWHIWDGRKDGFNALVNYHMLCGSGFQPLDSEAGSLSHSGARTLESLTYAYLGDWITRQKDAVAQGEAGAEDRLAAAQELQNELKKIAAGEPPYDLFIRWKPLHQQPIGWQPDINDGVRLNIRPFLVSDLSRGKKGAGLFRVKPGSSLKWTKDRGKEPSRPKEDFPWFWTWDEQTVDFAGNSEFDGNRWNDCHYTTAFKRAASERKAK